MHFDDTLEKQLLSNVRQVVILGSGLDTRAVRKAVPGVTYYEIDDAETLAVKRARYDALGFELDLRLIPGNYVSDGLIDLLGRNRFDFDLPTYLIWEGNTMYLPLDRMKRVLTELRTSRDAVPRRPSTTWRRPSFPRQPAIPASRTWLRASRRWVRRGCQASVTLAKPRRASSA